MNAIRKIEVFSAGCPACADVIDLINKAACPSCEITVLDMHDSKVVARAKSLGVRSVPAIAIDGVLADCCVNRGPAVGLKVAVNKKKHAASDAVRCGVQRLLSA